MSLRRTFILSAVVSAVLFNCHLAPAATNIFLKLEGISGESKDYAHPSEINVVDWSWGISNTIPTDAASLTCLSLTKYADTATPLLMKMCAGGGPITTAALTVRYGGKSPVVFLHITMTDVLVSSVATGGPGSDDRLTEKVKLTFSEVNVTYTPLSGPLPKTNYGFIWNTTKNEGETSAKVMPDPTPAGGLASTLTYTNGARSVSLTWTSTAGTFYQVWVAPNPTPPFEPYGNPIPASATGKTSILLPVNAIRKFFRIETLPAE